MKKQEILMVALAVLFAIVSFGFAGNYTELEHARYTIARQGETILRQSMNITYYQEREIELMDDKTVSLRYRDGLMCELSAGSCTEFALSLVVNNERDGAKAYLNGIADGKTIRNNLTKE